MIKVFSPRIQNLGDFIHCLPTLSGLYKTFGEKISLGICDRMQRFRGIKELLSYQEMFCEVKFMHEENLNLSTNQYIVIDDSGKERDFGNSAIVCHRFHNFVVDNYNIEYKIDDDFELLIPKYDIDYHENKIIVGDRWSPKDAPDVDVRRKSNLIEESEILPKDSCFYLDYSADLLYNCSLIKYNSGPFVTTFTGIGIVADLMKKETYVLWDEDMRNWQGWGVEYDFKMHYYRDRNSKLVYIKDFNL